MFAAGSTRLLGARLVDAGSGYDAQNDMPVHVGIPAGVTRVDVQLIVPRGGRRGAGLDARRRPGGVARQGAGRARPVGARARAARTGAS